LITNIFLPFNVSIGLLAEYDSPHQLLMNPEGAFSHFVNETGEEHASQLRIAAHEAATKDSERGA